MISEGPGEASSDGPSRALLTSRQRAKGPLYRLYINRLRRHLDPARVPHHIGMMIDGNRRWARQSGFSSVSHGHRAGARKMTEFLQWCSDIGVQVVTLYLLSHDNLKKRDSQELHDLIEIIAGLASDLSERQHLRVQHVGSAEGLAPTLVDALECAEDRTRGNDGLHVNLAVGYGGRNEIVDAIRALLTKAGDEGLTPHEIAASLTDAQIAEHLYTVGQKDPDLVIRTSGEQRLSDFLLWQSAHSEFYFMEALGPDLREVDFLRAIRAFASRDRRFGG